ncbi:MAG TPA: FecR domain-containing protein, partial [Magnetospirillum sp.]|nr:FecR domain-containing protein [Magnetospirillum sp.]
HHTREVPPGMAETITLADGSTMILSGGGAAEIPFAPWARRVRLVRGEALFTVVHHDDIPFAVECGTAEVVDVGTRFVVHADATGPSVAVFEGVVHLNAGSSGSQFLKAGQAAAVLPSGIVPQPAENEADATAWRTGVVVFHNTPLSVAAHRLATAWGRPVTITQPALADLRVSGRFRLEDQAGLLRALSLALPISVRYGASGIDFLPR